MDTRTDSDYSSSSSTPENPWISKYLLKSARSGLILFTVLIGLISYFLDISFLHSGAIPTIIIFTLVWVLAWATHEDELPTVTAISYGKHTRRALQPFLVVLALPFAWPWIFTLLVIVGGGSYTPSWFSDFLQVLYRFHTTGLFGAAIITLLVALLADFTSARRSRALYKIDRIHEPMPIPSISDFFLSIVLLRVGIVIAFASWTIAIVGLLQAIGLTEIYAASGFMEPWPRNVLHGIRNLTEFGVLPLLVIAGVIGYAVSVEQYFSETFPSDYSDLRSTTISIAAIPLRLFFWLWALIAFFLASSETSTDYFPGNFTVVTSIIAPLLRWQVQVALALLIIGDAIYHANETCAKLSRYPKRLHALGILTVMASIYFASWGIIVRSYTYPDETSSWTQTFSLLKELGYGAWLGTNPWAAVIDTVGIILAIIFGIIAIIALLSSGGGSESGSGGGGGGGYSSNSKEKQTVVRTDFTGRKIATSRISFNGEILDNEWGSPIGRIDRDPFGAINEVEWKGKKAEVKHHWFDSGADLWVNGNMVGQIRDE